MAIDFELTANAKTAQAHYHAVAVEQIDQPAVVEATPDEGIRQDLDAMALGRACQLGTHCSAVGPTDPFGNPVRGGPKVLTTDVSVLVDDDNLGSRFSRHHRGTEPGGSVEGRAFAQ